MALAKDVGGYRVRHSTILLRLLNRQGKLGRVFTLGKGPFEDIVSHLSALELPQAALKWPLFWPTGPPGYAAQLGGDAFGIFPSLQPVGKAQQISACHPHGLLTHRRG